MSQVFIDGFDHYATADITKKWTAVSNTTDTAIESTGGRNGTGAMRTNFASTVSRTFAQTATWIIGFAFNPSGYNSNFLQLKDNGTVQVNLFLNTDGTVSIQRNGSNVTGGTTSVSLTTGVFTFIEFKVTIASSIGASSCVLKFNGATVATVSTGQNLQSSGNASANVLQLMGSTGGGNGKFYFDDLYVFDSNGSANNDFGGDCRIETLYPNGAGNSTQWTPSTGSNYANVDDTTPNGDTNYNSASGTGLKDTYTMTDLGSTPSSIKGIQIVLTGRKDDAGTKVVIPVIRSGGADYDGTSANMGDAYSMFIDIRETDPATSTAWTASGINALEAGIKVG